MKVPGMKVLRKDYFPWWAWILGVDLFLIFVTVLKKYPIPLPKKGFLGNHFNLATEMNLAVWWSGISLFLLALLAYRSFSLHRGGIRKAWLLLAIIFALLSLDEIGSLHERIDGWDRLFLVGSLPLAMVGLALAVLFKKASSPRQPWLVLSGFLLLGTVAFQEYLEHLIDWPEGAIGLRRGLEEGSELFGFFLFFLGLIGKRRSGEAGFLRTLLPDPVGLNRLPTILTLGVLAHILASLFLPRYVDVYQKGNPLVWYPIVVFFLLFALAYWRFREGEKKERRSWFFLACFFLASSVALIYPADRLLSGLVGWLDREYLVGLEGLAGMAVLSAFGFLVPGFPRRKFRQILMLLCLSLIGFFLAAYGLEFLMPGILAYLVFQVFGTWAGSPAELTGANNKGFMFTNFPEARET